MVHIINVIKGINTKRKLGRYRRSKQIAEDIFRKKKPKISIIDRLYYIWAMYIKCGFIKGKFRVNLNNRFVLWLATQYYALVTYGTFTNYICKSILGFIGGSFLTYSTYTFLAIPLNFHIFNSTYISAIFMLILPLGLAFSMIVRCIVLSIIPQLFTRQGRQALSAYAFILLLNGPTRNLVYNTAIFSDTLSCTQEQLKLAARNVTEIVLKPLRSLRNTMIEVMKCLRVVINKVKEVLVFIKDSIVSIVHALKKASDWLSSSNSLCSGKIANPYYKCIAAFYEANKQCEETVPGFLRWSCDITKLASVVCEPAKLLNFYCQFVSYLQTDIFDVIKEKLRDFVRYIKTLFYVSISFHHSYAFKTNQSKTLRQVAREVINDVEDRLSFFFFIFDQISVILCTFLFYLIFRTFAYWYRFLNHDWFDNRYINQHLLELDMIRIASKRRSLFPLTADEKRRFVYMNSFRLTIYEKKILFSDLGFMLKSTMHILIHLFLDFSVYWVLTVVEKYAGFSTKFSTSTVYLLTQGEGFMAHVYRFIHIILKPFAFEINFTTYPCLPHPIPPDFVRYQQILSLLLIVWFMVIFEPYGLRFRNYIMTYYNEDAGRRRAVWLFNYLTQGRFSILSYARKQINRKASFGIRDDTDILVRHIIFTIPYLWYCCPYKEKQDNCIMCEDGAVADYQCTTPECYAAFCNKCLNKLDGTCSLCRMATTLDSDDMSEESASESEDDNKLNNEVTKATTSQLLKTDGHPKNSQSQSLSEVEFYSVDLEDENPSNNSSDGKTVYYSPINTDPLFSLKSEENESDQSDRHSKFPRLNQISINNPKTDNALFNGDLSGSKITKANRYFKNRKNKIDWATMDDFDLPVPYIRTWIQPV